MRTRQAHDLLRERHPRTIRRQAAEPPDQQIDLDVSTRDRRIDQPAAVPPVDPLRDHPAAGAYASGASNTGPYPQPITRPVHPIDNETRQVRKENSKVREAPGT